MIKTTVHLALRSFRSNTLITVGSVLCLFLGTLSLSLLFSYLQQVWNKDDFNNRKKNIYFAAFKDFPETPTMSICASEYLGLDYQQYPGIETSTFVATMDVGKDGLQFNGTIFHPEILAVDSNFFKVFDYRLLMGDKRTVLNEIGTVVLSERIARKLYGKANPVGNSLELDGKQLTVKGVVQNTSTNSSLTFDVLVQTNWEKTSYAFGKQGAEYLLTTDKFDVIAFNSRLNQLSNAHTFLPYDNVFLIPFREAYVKLDMQNHNTLNREVVYRHEDQMGLFVFLSLLVVILLITVLNYSTLQWCQSRAESKSIGIHRLAGASPQSLVGVQVVKSILIILFVGVLTMLTISAIQQWFNQLAAVRLNPSLLEIVTSVFSVLTLIVLVGWLNPWQSLLKSFYKNLFKVGMPSKGTLIRMPALVFQFLLSITLIFVTLVVNLQLNQMRQLHPGLDVESVIRTNLPDGMYEELDQNPFIEAYSTGYSPFNPVTSALQVAERPGSLIPVNGLFVEPGYEKVFVLKLKEGRFFDRTHEPYPDDNSKVVINEAAKKEFNIQDITNEHLSDFFNSPPFEIIGVVEDFNYQHLSFKPKPLVMMCLYSVDYEVIVRFKKGSQEAGLASLQKLYKDKVDTKGSLNYTFISEDANSMYPQEKRFSHLCLLFTLIGLLITLVGLFTLVYAETQRRVKEIGIRRVNGAGIPSILFLLQSDLIQAFAVAFILSCPISWFVMHRWLENFTYHIPLSWWLFALSGLFAFVVALLTVSGLSWRAATRNPVEALRDE